jgi:hypothetical protein
MESGIFGDPMQNLMNKTLIEILAEVAVTTAITAGKLQESQREWAQEFFKRDPEGFRRYTCLVPKRKMTHAGDAFGYACTALLERKVADLEKEAKRLRAEYAFQQGTIRALNEEIINLKGAPEKTEPQLPRWQSHKIVDGDKIIKVWHSGTRWDLACGVTIEVSQQLENRVPHGVDPLGGYYVRYNDNFESWSPSEAFEKGYTRIGEAP